MKRRSDRVLGMFVSGLVLLAGAAPAAGQVSYSGPTILPVGGDPATVAIGDVNRDGIQDLVAGNCCTNGDIAVLLGDGTGGFGSPQHFADGGDNSAIAIGNLNGDVNPDLIVGRGTSVTVLLGDGTGNFGTASSFAVGNPARSIAVGDLNDDSNLDVAVATYSSNVAVLLGNGTGAFGAPTNFTVVGPSASVAIGDLNRDSKPDLGVVNGGYDAGNADLSILLGNGAGGFGAPRNFAAGELSSALAIADLNGDTKLDVAVTNQTSLTLNGASVSVFLGDGTGNLGTPHDFLTGFQTVTVGDVNGDSRQDLITPCNNCVSILLGEGTGRFPAQVSFSTGPDFPPYGSRGTYWVTTGDLNGDGRRDVVAANEISGDLAVLLNTTPPAPDCSSVAASPSVLQPVNAKFKLVSLSNATVPGGGAATPTITGVTQDEAVGAPDAQSTAVSSQVQLRAERESRGNGRVYRVSFTASSSQGGVCYSVVRVSVPVKRGGTAIDDGDATSFDSFTGSPVP